MNIHTLAFDFSEGLRDAITAEQMRQVLERNASETDSLVCHSHDFCDANECMLAALELQSIEFDPSDDAQAKAMNKAWDIAKAAKFFAIGTIAQSIVALHDGGFCEDALSLIPTLQAAIVRDAKPDHDCITFWDDSAVMLGSELYAV